LTTVEYEQLREGRGRSESKQGTDSEWVESTPPPRTVRDPQCPIRPDQNVPRN
jgi:hypothetical protein